MLKAILYKDLKRITLYPKKVNITVKPNFRSFDASNNSLYMEEGNTVTVIIQGSRKGLLSKILHHYEQVFKRITIFYRPKTKLYLYNCALITMEQQQQVDKIYDYKLTFTTSTFKIIGEN